jgi:hypothetical protein
MKFYKFIITNNTLLSRMIFWYIIIPSSKIKPMTKKSKQGSFLFRELPQVQWQQETPC